MIHIIDRHVLAELITHVAELANTVEELRGRSNTSITPEYKLSETFCVKCWDDHLGRRCPYLSLCCIYCREKHDFDDCPYNPDSWCYIGPEGCQSLLNPFPNEHKQGWREYPKTPWAPQLDVDSFEEMLKLHKKQVQQEAHESKSIEELVKEYKASMDVKIESEATSQQNSETQTNECANEVEAKEALFNYIQILYEEEKKQGEAMTLESGLEKEPIVLLDEARSTPTLESIEDPEEREEIIENSLEKSNKKEEQEEEVVVSHAAATSQQRTFNATAALKCPEVRKEYYAFGLINTFNYVLQEALKRLREGVEETVMENEHTKYATTKPSMIKAPQLRLKSRPLSRPRCKMKEQDLRLVTRILISF